MGQAEDEIRIDAQDALAALDGLDVRRMFSGWGFYRHSLLFASAFDGEFRFRYRQDGRWRHEPVDRGLLDRPDDLIRAAREVLAMLEQEPAARPRPKSKSSSRSRYSPRSNGPAARGPG